MNKRIISIIDELNEPKKQVAMSDLAAKFGVSERTIRNDLNTISELLKENGLTDLKLKNGGQIVRESDFEKIYTFIEKDNFYSYRLSKEERKRIAAALLVNSAEHITLSTIADNLFVSRATVINDLDEIKAYIKTGSLEVLSHPNKGLRVDGKESDKRLFLLKNMDEDMETAKQGAAKQVNVLAGDSITIQKIVYEQEHIYKSFLTDESFQKVLHYLGIMVNRNMQGEYIEKRTQTNNSKFCMAQDIIKYISQYCHINTTEDEVAFLSEILILSRYIRKEAEEKNAVKTQMITRQFIEQISEELGINLRGDYDFFENLSNHLESVFSDQAPSCPDNPVIDEALEENQEVVDAVRRKFSVIRQYMNRDITEGELDYIAVHVCAALERKKNREIAFHVIVACHAGIGTSQLLMAKLKRHFNFQIVDVISSHEAKHIEEGKADFIISTVPLEGCRLDYVIVSPLLNDEDYIRVGNKIDSLRNNRKISSYIETEEISAKGLLEKITPIIYENAPEQAELLIRKIRKEVRNYFNQTAEEEAEVFSPSLHHLLPASHIELDVACEDWKDAVRKSAQKLLEMGYIEERYIQAMIENIEENGPYIVISKGFAVPHEGLEQGSVKVGMSLIRLKKPVAFGAEELDPVRFVCCLSAVDHKTHLKAFFHLINMLKDEKFKDQLENCETAKEAGAVIEKFEYETTE